MPAIGDRGHARSLRRTPPNRQAVFLTMPPDRLFDFYVQNGIKEVGFNIEEIEGAHSHSSLASAHVETRFRRFIKRLFEPNRETLPHTVAPLRYLFLRSAYERARRTYIIASLLLYG